MTATARDQVARMLALVPYLQRGEGVPLRQVADDFGVSTTQVTKDLQVLWMCGLPGPGELIDIDFEAFEDDPEGLVRLSNAEYLTRPLRLDSTEASALIVALRALRDTGPSSAREVVDRVLGKLEEATAGVTGPVTAQPGPRDTAEADVADVVRRAIDADRRLLIDYYVPSRDEKTQRRVDPLAQVEREGHAYLDAWCHLAGGRRLFRLDRVDAIELLDEPREHTEAPEIDLGEHLFQPGPDAIEAVLRLRPGARWVADYYPVDDVRETGDGELEVRMRVNDPRWLVRLVLGQAPGITVVSPEAIAAEVTAQARSALASYR